MLWLIGVAVFCFAWFLIIKNNALIGTGILIGVLLAWALSYLIKPYFETGLDMENVPVWLPPLPLATIATVLIVYGVIIWVRGNDALPKPPPRKDSQHH